MKPVIAKAKAISTVQSEADGGCWLCGQTNKAGYPSFCFDGGKVGRRGMFETATGKRLTRQQTVRMSCGVYSCINPAHMYVVLRADYIRETFAGKKKSAITRLRVSRAARKRATTKLDEAKAREVRARLAEGETQRAIARDLQVSSGTISEVARGITWRETTPFSGLLA